MSTMIFVNFPVKNVADATDFYEKLGFTKNDDFSSVDASCMVWDENFYIMLLEPSFYQQFLKDKKIADTHKENAALICFSMESADAVKEFGRLAKENGGDAYHIDMGMPEEQMYGLEVSDIDGNMLEPMWMKQ
ncbi:glyoxalase [Bacillus sp. SD088]|uniref:glyoxalase n=1 Tax=Bacillus sp. SD088 TaxID=2782012 RepID=UPI001A977357|nr:glyoxalase [Bacillus sp. SD088]MBO0993551.1 glyoxalase [Bacillus sp. SD088]